jgi:hypothetical protein
LQTPQKKQRYFSDPMRSAPLLNFGMAVAQRWIGSSF